ncbi:hypothetical protein [Rickettsia canadensis]|uniref:hypothetical protein n=1 Tax=Rickettsia canadensis TaxID=788 RepID=UPI0002D66D55|nr:hypothetical protein [Rickettsia canadensis]
MFPSTYPGPLILIWGTKVGTLTAASACVTDIPVKVMFEEAVISTFNDTIG